MNRKLVMPDTLNDTVLDRAGLESIQTEASLPRIVREGERVLLKVYFDRRDHEIELSADTLGGLIADGFRIYRAAR